MAFAHSSMINLSCGGGGRVMRCVSRIFGGFGKEGRGSALHCVASHSVTWSHLSTTPMGIIVHSSTQLSTHLVSRFGRLVFCVDGQAQHKSVLAVLLKSNTYYLG